MVTGIQNEPPDWATLDGGIGIRNLLPLGEGGELVPDDRYFSCKYSPLGAPYSHLELRCVYEVTVHECGTGLDFKFEITVDANLKITSIVED